MRYSRENQATKSQVGTDRPKDMISRHRSLGIVAAACCLLAVGCGSQFVKTLVDIAKLRTEIVKKFGEEGVNVRVNNSSTVVVTFINSPLNDQSWQERSKRALETALVVKAHYPAIKTIDAIWVGFSRQESHFGVINYAEYMDHFGFDNEARPLIIPEEDPATSEEDDSQPIARYSPTARQTDISLTGIQLEGEPGAGVTMIPHFTLTGDATRTALKAPMIVTFDFASYAPKPKFPGLSTITISADRKIVFEAKGQFSTSKLADGTFSEFLHVPLPYRAFSDMTAGENVSIKGWNAGLRTI